MMIRFFSVVLMLWLTTFAAHADNLPQELNGQPSRIVDGDTIHLSGHKIRLLGIDTPEIKQFCIDRSGVKWPCGQRARDMLVGMVSASENVHCQISGQDRYKRLLGRCYANGLDVQKALISAGFGVAEYTEDYLDQERFAQDQKLGMWAGTFQRPRDYRRNK